MWVGETLTDIENKGKVLDKSDAGGYYDPETGIWHMYYEGVPSKGSLCSLTINHAVSEDGVDWEKKGIALDVRDYDWKTGDPDVVRIGDTRVRYVPQLKRFVMYQEFFGTKEKLQGGVG